MNFLKAEIIALERKAKDYGKLYDLAVGFDRRLHWRKKISEVDRIIKMKKKELKEGKPWKMGRPKAGVV